MAHPPAPGKKGKGPVFWGIVGCCGCLLLGFLGFAAIVGGAFMMSAGAVEAVHAQLKDLKEGNLDAAYARTSASYQAEHPAAAFAAFVERHPGLKANTDSTFTNRSVENNTARISGSLTHAGGTESVVYKLVKEGEQWKISGIEVDGDEGAGDGSSPPSGSTGGGTSGDLALETTDLTKTPQGQGIEVAIKTRVTGFDVKPEGSIFRMDLAEDLETFGPDGERIPKLSRVGLHTLNDPASAATGSAADFTTTLTFVPVVPGSYKAVITIRDMVGSKIAKQDVPFDLP